MHEPCFFHLDMDAFYASVEQYDNPALSGKPVVVGGASNRGVVSACSYEAREFGIHSAMPIFQAKKLCPHAIFLPVRMQRYLVVSEHVMDILRRYSPVIHQISIDEAFLDMTGTELLLGNPVVAAGKIKESVKTETGLTISIGIGSSKLIAKMASAKGKPDGLFFVRPGKEIEFIDSLGIRDIWGIGAKGAESLACKGITSIQQLRECSPATLSRQFGEASAAFFHAVSHGRDPGLFTERVKSKSISNEITLSKDLIDSTILLQVLFDLSHQVFFRTFKEQVIGKTAVIKLKYSDFTNVSARKTCLSPILSAEQLFDLCQELFRNKWNGRPVRLIGAGISSLEKGSMPAQDELFDNGYKRKRKLEQAVFSMEKSGMHVMKASSLLHRMQKERKEK